MNANHEFHLFLFFSFALRPLRPLRRFDDPRSRLGRGAVERPPERHG